VNAEARGLNNSNTTQYIYNYDNDRFVLDVPYASANNGTRIKLGLRNGGRAQKFWAENRSQSIKSDLNTNLCLDASGNNVTYSTAIILWQCNGQDNQKWFFDGNLIRSWKDPKFCIDAAGGNLNNETPIQLWDCDQNNKAQKYVAGLDNFGAKFDVNINASGTGWYNNGFQTGHVFLSYFQNDRLVNTQSAFPGWDNSSNRNCENYKSDIDQMQRVNNICDDDAAWVDADADIYNAKNKAGDGKEFKVKSRNIGKKVSDKYRFSSGYRQGGDDKGRANINYTGAGSATTNFVNCATQSVGVWNRIMRDVGQAEMNIIGSFTPGMVNIAMDNYYN
jgi:hypothetical protein